MSNLYYGFRGDGASQRGLPPQAHQQQPPAQSLLGSEKTSTNLQNGLVSSFGMGNALSGSAIRHPSSSASALPFPGQQPWASDVQNSQSSQPQRQQHSSLQQQSQPQNLGPAAFQPSQSLRPGTITMNNGRIPAGNRPSQYADGGYYLMNKDFGDVTTSAGGLTANADVARGTSSIPRIPTQPTAQNDQYAHSAQLGSNVFDPNEFPSLGSGSNGGASAAAASATLPGTSAVDNLASGLSASLAIGVNGVGVGGYNDPYSLGSYGSGRPKVVDALTGTGPAAEFSIQSEDFPALGGGPNGTSARGGNSGTSTQAPVHGGVISGHNQVLALDRSQQSVTSSYFPGSLQSSHGQHGAPLSSSHIVGGTSGSANANVFPSRGEPTVSSDPFSSADGKGSAQSNLSGNFLSAGQQASQSGDAAFSQLRQVQQFPPNDGNPMRTSVAQSLFEGTHHHAQDPNSQMPSALYDTKDKSGALGPNSQMDRASSHRDRGDASNNSGTKKLGAQSDLYGDTKPSSQAFGTNVLSFGNGNSMDSSDSITGNHEDGNGTPDVSILPSDHYGMKGLLRVLQPQQGHSDIALLSLGLDLTMLGLNLSSQEPLHLTFDSPWDGGQTTASANKDADSSLTAQAQRGEEPDYHLPSCYYMSPPALKATHFAKFQLETLFYIFYNLPRDVLQQLAALELYTREWRYHKDLKLWFTRAPGTSQGTHSGGTHIYFDIKLWERRPFQDANGSFAQGFMSEEELRSVHIPPHMSST